MEFLTTGRITLPVPEPQLGYLRVVRRGEVELDEILAAVSRAEKRLGELRGTAAVPDQPDHEWVDRWLHRTHLAYWAD